MRALSEQQRCVRVRRAEDLRPDVRRARCVVGEFDIICQQGVRQHGLEFIDRKEAPRARKKRKKRLIDMSIATPKSYHAWRPVPNVVKSWLGATIWCFMLSPLLSLFSENLNPSNVSAPVWRYCNLLLTFYVTDHGM